jgi:hypothetical protein
MGKVSDSLERGLRRMGSLADEKPHGGFYAVNRDTDEKRAGKFGVSRLYKWVWCDY